ncbi:MAG: serine protease [Roseburia sp.]|nr:serine protease [Roseburia sp.]
MEEKLRTQLSFFVGKLSDSRNSALASCFPVSNDLVVTCYHAIRNNDTFFITWKSISNIIVRQAKIIGDYLSEDADIAFLQLSEPLPKSFAFFEFGFHWTENGSFQTYGFRKADYYDGLSASGVLRTETQKVNTHTKLIQLDCRDIDKGMSGAPVLDTTYNTIVGMVCEYWNAQSSTDSSLAFAVPTSELINVNASIKSAVPELNAAPKYTESGKFKKALSPTVLLNVEEQYIFACSRLAVIVAADQFTDGSWGRSLWKETGIKYTTDVADKHTVQTTHEKKR